MLKIDDTGKVWFPGAFTPEYAVRVGEKVYVPGKSEEESIHCWVTADTLCVDLNDAKKAMRTARRMPLSLPATKKAALFAGFENTAHGDVGVVTQRDSGVEKIVFAGEAYREHCLETLDSAAFWKLAEDSGP